MCRSRVLGTFYDMKDSNIRTSCITGRFYMLGSVAIVGGTTNWHGKQGSNDMQA